MNWADEVANQINVRIEKAGNHIVLVPSQSKNAAIDTVDVFDGGVKTFIATGVPEKPAAEFATIYNGLIDDGEQIENIRKINLYWLTGVDINNKVYS